MNIKNIIVHHSLTKDGQIVSWSAIRRYHVQKKGWNGIGYHFGIELVYDHYEILLGRLLNEQGAHCKGHNHNSWGICLIGNFDLVTPENTQLIVAKRLIRSLLDISGLNINAVKRHADFSSKSCPGKYFPWDDFIRCL